MRELKPFKIGMIIDKSKATIEDNTIFINSIFNKNKITDKETIKEDDMKGSFIDFYI